MLLALVLVAAGVNLAPVRVAAVAALDRATLDIQSLSPLALLLRSRQGSLEREERRGRLAVTVEAQRSQAR